MFKSILFLFLSILFAQEMEAPTLQTQFSSGPLSDKSTLEVTIRIQDGWHITSDKPEDEFSFPVKLDLEAQGIQFGQAVYPSPTVKYIKALEMNSSYFEGEFIVQIPITSISPQYDSLSLSGTLHYQSCTNKVCLAPAKTTFGALKKKTPTPSPVAISQTSQTPLEQKSATPTTQDSFVLILLFALLGGLLLNLMPCVLPVIALKVYALVRQAEHQPKTRLKLGFSFSLGILVSLWSLGAMVLLLRSAGEAVGWGFQFQNAGFLLFMVGLLSLFSFNLFGLFEFNLSSNVSTKAVRLSSKEGALGAFSGGVFMTLLATPCSAPFLGPALGYAFSQSATELILTLTSVGIGLALPYFLLTWVPQLQRFLPKPGDWMVHFKHFTGFVLLATALFLLWVLGEFGGQELVIMTLIWVLAAGLWSWIIGQWAAYGTPAYRKYLLWILLIGFTGYWASQVLRPLYLNPPQIQNAQNSLWKPFSPEAVAQSVSKNQAVFIDFTAKWCLSCKANKKLVLETEDVTSIFKQNNVALYRADWTHKDDVITQALAQFGRSAVPTYVFYDKNGKTQVLPEVLSKSIIQNLFAN